MTSGCLTIQWRRTAGIVGLLGTVLASGCSLPGRIESPAPRVYLLEDSANGSLADDAELPGCLTLRVAPPRAAPGFDTARMAYSEKLAELSYFAWHRWADTPARMLAMLIEQRLDARNLFEQVLADTRDVSTDLRLEVQHLRLLQRVRGDSSEIHLSAKLRLVDLDRRHVLGQRAVQVAVPAAAATPTAGVEAAQRATGQFLDSLEQFVASTAAGDCVR